MITDSCENCKWSRGYHAANREDALLLMCVHPDIRYNEEIGDISIFCLSQRTPGRIVSFFSGACGSHARFFKQRGQDGTEIKS